MTDMTLKASRKEIVRAVSLDRLALEVCDIDSIEGSRIESTGLRGMKA